MTTGSARLGRLGMGLVAVAVLALTVTVASCSSSSASCAQGLTSCGGTCVDLSTDPNNCGDCNVTCDVGAACQPTGGTPPGTCTCPPPTQSCGIHCVDTQTNSQNCGGCGKACGLGHCATGACQCNTSPATVASCPAPANPTCVDLAADAANCGACGNACLSGESCVATGTTPVGLCTCLAPLVLCPNPVTPTKCADLSTDPFNCGTCGNACPTGQRCTDGVCGGTCQPGFVFCNGVCVNTLTDPANCGRCGNACAAGQGCTNGTCGTCTLQCGGQCCQGGTGCCGTACQSQHKVFPGTADEVTSFDCFAPGVYDLTTATIAAQTWAPNGNTITTARSCPDGVGPSLCLTRQTGTLGAQVQCAVFCYSGPFAGSAQLTKGSFTCPCPTTQQIDWY